VPHAYFDGGDNEYRYNYTGQAVDGGGVLAVDVADGFHGVVNKCF